MESFDTLKAEVLIWHDGPVLCKYNGYYAYEIRELRDEKGNWEAIIYLCVKDLNLKTVRASYLKAKQYYLLYDYFTKQTIKRISKSSVNFEELMNC